MEEILKILRSKLKPKEKQERLVEAVCDGRINSRELIDFFQSAIDTDKGTCADVMKHVSERKPELLAPYIDLLIGYINYKAPRVKWGVPEAIGNLAGKYPDKAAGAVPFLLKNTIIDAVNTTVIRWCAAFALSKIAQHNITVQAELIPKMEKIIKMEKNNGVRNVYLKALKNIGK